MDVPLFLLMILKKMSKRVMEKYDTPSHFIYHKILIKLLIESYLRKINKTWENFIFWGCFLESIAPKPKSISKRKRSKKPIKPARH